MRLSYGLFGAIALAGTRATPCRPDGSSLESISTKTAPSDQSDTVSSSASASVSDVSVSLSTSSVDCAVTSATASKSLPGGTVDSTILIFAKDDHAASSAGWGFEGYGIPFEKVLVPQTGFELPTLNSSSTKGNYGGIVVVDSVSYEYSDGWRSAISTEQWDKIYEYQASFKVRLVRINEFPGPNFGKIPTVLVFQALG